MSGSACLEALGSVLREFALAIGREPRFRVSDETSDGQACLRGHLVELSSSFLDAAPEIVVRHHREQGIGVLGGAGHLSERALATTRDPSELEKELGVRESSG